MLAGGLGGVTGDMIMHSLDTVKTRQQGDPHRPPKYTSLGSSYFTILRQEGIRRGLYGGVKPAFVGSFGGTSIFFGTYEWSKRRMVDFGIAPSIAYFCAGLLADLVASPLYVPTEVLKTRLQLQGRYNNSHFDSGYNYRSTWHAAKTIAKAEGMAAFFHGYRATLYRDLPFSALQFAFYEKERQFAQWWTQTKDINTMVEILVGASASGAAGAITCPLDVVKTRIQVQRRAVPAASPDPVKPPLQQQQRRHISTTSPPSLRKRAPTVMLDTSSVTQGLKIIYRAEGLAGCFRGLGPRFCWTSIQGGIMLPLYQALLRTFGQHFTPDEDT